MDSKPLVLLFNYNCKMYVLHVYAFDTVLTARSACERHLRLESVQNVLQANIPRNNSTVTYELRGSREHEYDSLS